MYDIVSKFAWSIIPAIALVLFVIYRDRKNPEPAKKIIKGVWFGIISIFVTFAIHIVWLPLPELLGFSWVSEVPIIRSLHSAFYEAAIPEETAKLLMLWLLLRKCKEFDENIDGVVYAVCVGMGFAGLENVLYVFSSEEWQSVAFTRSLLAVPGHYIDAVLMGLFYSLVHFHPEKYGKFKFLVWFVPVMSHGIYDTICFVQEENILFTILGMIALIAFCIILHIYCLKVIKNLLAKDMETATIQPIETIIADNDNQES